MGECIHIRRDVNALTFLPFLWEETTPEGHVLGCVNDVNLFFIQMLSLLSALWWAIWLGGQYISRKPQKCNEPQNLLVWRGLSWPSASALALSLPAF